MQVGKLTPLVMFSLVVGTWLGNAAMYSGNMAGNTMHINSVGIVMGYMLLCLCDPRCPDFFDIAVDRQILDVLNLGRSDARRLASHAEAQRTSR